MANIFKKAASGLMEKMFTRSEVVAVRSWEPAMLYEIDVHVPTVNIERWDTIRRVKCQVGELEYRDYTPALWDVAKRIFTLFIEAGHNGSGARWVSQLKKGDEILLSPVHAAQLPAREGKVLGIGDGSALGHFLGLKQLTDQSKFPLEVGIFLHHEYELPTTLLSSNPEFEFLMDKENESDALIEWCRTKDLRSYSSFYIAGNIPMVTTLRKLLKAASGTNAKVYSYGFWS